MDVILDGNNITVELSSEEEPAEFINNRLAADNLVISALTVNDAEMVNIPLEEILKNEDAVQVIRIETAPAKEFSIEALLTAAEYIPRLKDGLSGLREKVFEGDLEHLKVLVEEAIEGLQWLMIATQAATRQINKPSSQKQLDAELNNIKDAFGQMEKALEKDDYTLICDLFEYEICPFLDILNEHNLKLIDYYSQNLFSNS